MTQTHRLLAGAPGLLSVPSQSFDVIKSSGLWPNAPNLPRIAEHGCDGIPPSPAGPSGLAGIWNKVTAGHVVVAADPAAPFSPSSVWRSRYQAGVKIGTSPSHLEAWDGSGLGTNNQSYNELYFGLWVNFYGNGTDFEMVAGSTASLIKPFGYVGYGSKTIGARNQGYWVWQSPVGNVTSGTLKFVQQNNVSRSVPGTTLLQVNTWYLLEFYLKANTVDVDDGLLKMWKTPLGGASVQFCNRIDMVYRTSIPKGQLGAAPNATLTAANHTTGFNLWNYSNVYGGNTTPDTFKTRDDDILFDHILMLAA